MFQSIRHHSCKFAYKTYRQNEEDEEDEEMRPSIRQKRDGNCLALFYWLPG